YARLTFQEPIVRTDTEVFKVAGLYKANPQTLSVFSFDFLKGGGASALSEPNSVILSQSLSEQFFGDIDAIGKSIGVDEKKYLVSGVFQDWPENSHLEVNALFSRAPIEEYDVQSWFDIEQYTYVLLEQATRQEDLDKQLDALAREELMPKIEGSGISVQFRSQSLEEVYVSPGLVDDVKKGNPIYANTLAVAGILILLIAGLNFINLMLTRSAQRSKEITLKKIMGMSSRALQGQNAIESFLMATLVLLLTAIIILIGEGLYKDFTGLSTLSFSKNWVLLPGFFLFVFALGILGSNYSGTLFSISDNTKRLKGKGINLFKKILLGFQYGMATIILVFALGMARQLDFIKHKDLGFAQDGIVIVDLPEDEETNNRSLQFKAQIQSVASVQSASLVGGGALPGQENGKDIFEVELEDSNTEKVYNIYRVDETYFELLDIQLAQGRNFAGDQLSDQSKTIIINAALAKSLNWKNPIGKSITYGGEKRTVIGMVKNFHNKSLHNIIEPIVFLYEPSAARSLLVKTKLSDIDLIKTTWSQLYPDQPFSLSYFDQFIGAMYTQETQLMRVFQFFTIIALLLCSTGLFALFSLHVLQRTKEMSVRKVLGANARQLLQSITKSYSTVAVIAMIIALPTAWLLIKKWLEAFSYRVTIGPDIFLLASLLILLISMLVIARHIAKVLKVDPAVELKR
ncbi:MAG: ABC transporter permease, partial [Bacteroidota bacterium]